MAVAAPTGSATFTTVLSQDAITTDKIVVDAQRSSPTAPFIHPGRNLPEALVVTGGRLAHVTRDPTAEAGWRLDPVGGGDGHAANAVAAGTTYKNTAYSATYAMFQDDSALQVLAFSGSGWGDPTHVVQQVHTHLRAAYSPGGKLVVHGTTPDGDLAIAHQPLIDQPFIVQTYSLPQPLTGGDYALCLTDDTNWTVAAAVDGKLWQYTGQSYGESATPSSSGRADNYDGMIQRVVFGYRSASQAALLFVFIDSAGALQTWSSTGVTPVPATASQANIVQAAGHVYVDPETGNDSIHVYTIDDNKQLCVLHQRTEAPWREDGSPNWAGMLPLDTQVAEIAIDSSPAETPTLFGVTADEWSLRLHSQDAGTGMWRSGEVMQSGGRSKTFEVVRHRAEVTFRDGRGAPRAHCPVMVSLTPGSSATDLCVGGATFPITAQGVQLTTNARGKLTFAVLVTSGLAAPQLDLDADGQDRVTVHLAQGIHDYLAGNGTLNPTNPTDPAHGAGPLPEFDGGGVALATATVSGQPLAQQANKDSLAPELAQAIRYTSMVGSNVPMPGVAGYRLGSISDGHAFSVIDSAAEVLTHMQSRAFAPASATASVWSGIEGFLGDVWEGIKNGAIEIVDVVVDCASKVANFTLKIAGEIRHGVEVALHGVEQAAHFMAGVFQMIGATIDKVIDWLKALFDFGAIWRTKQAFEQTILAGPTHFKAMAALADTSLDGWFTQQQDKVHSVIDAAKTKYAGQSIGDHHAYQPPGAPNASTKVAGEATAADFSDNVHHGWLQDKVEAAITSGDPVGQTLGSAGNPVLDPQLQRLLENIGGAVTDFEDAAAQLKAALIDLIRDPTLIATTGIVHFLTAAEDIIDAVLKLADAAAYVIVRLVDVLMDALLAILDTPLDVPVLQDLWAWMARSAGYPDDDKFTAAALVALIGAFPTTIIFKLVAGVSHEPFPPTAPTPPAPSAAARAFAMADGGHLGPVPMFTAPPGSVLASAILQTLAVVPANITDVLNEAAKTQPWLTLANFGLPLIITGTQFGFPDLSAQTWELVGAGGLVLGFLSLSTFVVLKGIDANFALAIPPDASAALTSAWGWLSLVGHAAIDIYEEESDMTKVISGLMLALPSAFAWLNLQSFRDDPELAPIALGAKLIINEVGYLTGGIASIVDAAEGLTRGA